MADDVARGGIGSLRAPCGASGYHSPLGGYGRCGMSGVAYYDSMQVLHTTSWSLGPADGLNGRSKCEQTAVRNGRNGR
eukprot:16828-Prymnesium_polylepis.1